MGCCEGGVILLRLRGSALLRQGLLSEPEASSAPVSMFLADFRSLSSIRRRSPARTAATSPAYGSFHPHTSIHYTKKKTATPKNETAVLSSHIIHRKSKHRKKIYLLTLLTVLPSRKALILSTVISMILCLEACAAQEICGVMMQFLALRSGLSPLDRLSRNNIKTSSINLPTIQSICHILLNNKLTTAVVDKDNSILLPLFAGTITSPG